jgi:hypothetical protein
VIVLAPWAFTQPCLPQWRLDYVGAHTPHTTQCEWLVDLSARVASDDSAPVSDQESVNIHIVALVSGFRELA